jgi:hypothetical protein
MLSSPDDKIDIYVSWLLGLIDKEGPWGWDELQPEDFWMTIKDKIGKYEKMSWQEILKHEKNHAVKISDLCVGAQRRLSEIGQDDIEDLVQIFITNTARIFGIRDGNKLKILWWDPKHSVCPSHLRNT